MPEEEIPVLAARADLLSYGRSEIGCSDHKPVCCAYTFYIRKVDMERENRMLIEFGGNAAMAAADERAIISKSQRTSSENVIFSP